MRGWSGGGGDDTRQVLGVYKERVPEARQHRVTPWGRVDRTPEGGSQALEAMLGRERLGMRAGHAQQHGLTSPSRLWTSLWIKHRSAGCRSLRG